MTPELRDLMSRNLDWRWHRERAAKSPVKSKFNPGRVVIIVIEVVFFLEWRDFRLCLPEVLMGRGKGTPNREEKSHNIQLIPVNPVKSKEKADEGFTLQIVLESYKGTK